MLLEWNKANGDAPAPMLKDKYGSERRKAKTLNFSIAYGKTKNGLAKDWGVSVNEAEETIHAWSLSLLLLPSPAQCVCTVACMALQLVHVGALECAVLLLPARTPPHRSSALSCCLRPARGAQNRYDARKEVKEWQDAIKTNARKNGCMSVLACVHGHEPDFMHVHGPAHDFLHATPKLCAKAANVRTQGCTQAHASERAGRAGFALSDACAPS